MYSDDEAGSGSSDDASSGRSGGEQGSDSDTDRAQGGTAVGLTGNKNCRKHTRQFIEHVVARATDTYEGEELGR
jgi:hypothetical protein